MDKPVATVVRDDGVAGSNPATPTSLRTSIRTDTTHSPALVVPKAAKGGRPPKGPRLYLRNDVDGTRSWIIRNNGRDIRTGCKEDNKLGALTAMDAYNGDRPILTRSDVNVGMVYFVTCITSANYPIKIGWTEKMATRLFRIQNGNPNTLTVLVTTPGTPKDERALHKRFGHLHIRGEWFRRGEDLSAYIKSLPAYVEAWGDDEFLPARAST